MIAKDGAAQIFQVSPILTFPHAVRREEHASGIWQSYDTINGAA
jgi:hypothetical protein